MSDAQPAARRPNFFLVGAMKAGTTSMHQYLAQHPDIYMSPRKEPRYSGFTPDLDRGTDGDAGWFTRQLDDYLDNFAGATDEKIVGESSHVYLHSEKAAGLIHDFDPDARILIMLRDPVKMIHARHQQSVWVTREEITDFAEALAAEPDRREGRRLPPNVSYQTGLLYRDACTLAPQVRRYLDAFGREQVHFAVLEDVAREPLAVYRGVLEFLGVDPDFKPQSMAAANQSKMYRNARLQRFRLRLVPIGRFLRRRMPRIAGILTSPSKLLHKYNRQAAPRQPMPPELEAELTDYFASDVKQLSELTGRDLSEVWSRFKAASESPAQG